MKIALTLVVRDEEDVLDENLSYHLGAGVDLVLVTDHRSQDGTPDILELHAQTGRVHVVREDEKFTQQQHWQTRMARLAFTEHGADWVLLGDADEFWWPRGRSLREALARVPDGFGSVRGLQRNFVPVQRGDGSFVERMTVRLSTPAPINDPATAYRPVVKVAVRGSAEVVIGKGGGHQAFHTRGRQFEAWDPLEILHFPLRSREQCARKYEKTWTGWKRNLRGDIARARQLTPVERADELWRRLALDGDTVERGLAEGSLVVDSRLRDALRSRRGTTSTGGLGDLAEAATHRLDRAVFSEAELVRHQRWLDFLGRRILELEHPLDADRTSHTG